MRLVLSEEKEHSKKQNFRGHVAAEEPSIFQADWPD
jgi:hypothetical protein